MMRHFNFLLPVLYIVLLGCGSGGSSIGNSGGTNPTSTPNASIQGPWVAFAQSSSAVGTAAVEEDFNLKQSGLSVTASGDGNIVYRYCLTTGFGGTLNLTVSGQNITGSLNDGHGETIALSGTVSVDNKTITGTYTASGPCSDSGTLQAESVALANGGYAGQLQSDGGSQFGILAVVQVDPTTFVPSGTITLSNSPCYQSLKIVGANSLVTGAFYDLALVPQSAASGDLSNVVFVQGWIEANRVGTLNGVRNRALPPTFATVDITAKHLSFTYDATKCSVSPDVGSGVVAAQ
jgi:hypothetical protein